MPNGDIIRLLSADIYRLVYERRASKDQHRKLSLFRGVNTEDSSKARASPITWSIGITETKNK